MERRPPPLSQRGFTAIELLIVVGLVAIVAAVSLPMYTSNIPRFQLKGAARMILADFQRARMEAVKRNCDVELVFSPATYSRAGGVGSYRMVESAGNTTLVARIMPKDVTLFDTNFPSDTAGYDSRGLPSSSGGSVFLVNNKGTAYKLALSTAGNVSTTMGQPAGFDVNGSVNPSTTGW